MNEDEAKMKENGPWVIFTVNGKNYWHSPLVQSVYPVIVCAPNCMCDRHQICNPYPLEYY